MTTKQQIHRVSMRTPGAPSAAATLDDAIAVLDTCDDELRAAVRRRRTPPPRPPSTAELEVAHATTTPEQS